MTSWEQTWAEAVLTAFLVDGSPGLNTKQGEVDYLSTMRRMRNGGTALAAFGLRAAVWMVATAPLWLLGRFVMFGTLAASERSEVLARLLNHKTFAVRELTLLLKLTAAMALLGTASVRARSHYDVASQLANAPASSLQPPSQQSPAPLDVSSTQPTAAKMPVRLLVVSSQRARVVS
jgi:hypothetical protein